MKYGYIYKTTNLINGKFYIGKHRGSAFDKTYLGSGLLIMKAVKKEGRKNFSCEVIEWCKTPDELNERERFWVEELNARDLTIAYNLCAGGMGGARHFTEDTLKRMSEMKKGTHHTKETIEKIKDAFRNMSEEDKQLRSKRLRESHIGKKHTNEQKAKIGKTLHNRYASGDLVSACKDKPSVNKGRKLTEEQANHCRQVCKGRIWIHNEVSSKMIFPEDLDTYEKLGWLKGRKYKVD